MRRRRGVVGKGAGRTISVERTIPAERERIQAELLVGTLGLLLVQKVGWVFWGMHRLGVWPPFPAWLWWSVAASVGFALVVWLLRAATGAAAVMGAFVCLNILLGQVQGGSWKETAMPGLIALFVLTFAATRFGRARKVRMRVAESKRGRKAVQILANLGMAGMCAGAGSPVLFAACVAALAEATADTVSSEMGQALGGRTLLITSWREVPAGTDGGISIAGTTLGAAAAGVIVLVMALVGAMTFEMGMVVFGAGVTGLVFDSWLGATVERRGWLGNDLVNFCSTGFAAAMAGLVMWGMGWG
ncbi:MAG: DUF92 domain-containing protein [Granulicella sp.]